MKPPLGRQAVASPAPGVAAYVQTQQITVPDVVGQPLLIAVRTLQRAGLSPRYPGAALTSVAAARVSGQDPPAGTRVAGKTPVTLTVEISTRIPSVVRLDVATATQWLARYGLLMDPRGSEYSDTIPPGRITRQHPDSGVAARRGDAVEVWTSLGEHPPEPARSMPRLIGASLAEARQLLGTLGLVVNHVDSIVDPAGAGLITAQRPAEGAPVHASDQVDVQLSVSPPARRVPWVVGMPLRKAEAVMKASGFPTRVRLVPTDRGTSGVVIEQEVDSGLTRPPRTVIALVATDSAAATETVPRVMPDVIGLARDVAIDSLRALSSHVTIVEVAILEERQNDQVVDQMPASGTIVVPMLDVVLRVGRYVAPPDAQPTQQADSALVPALVGRTMDEARHLLTAAQLTLGDVATAVLAGDSVVAAQVPGAGTVVAVGSAVSLTLQPAGGVPVGAPALAPSDDVVPGGRAFPRWPFLVAAAALGVLLLLLGTYLLRRRPAQSSTDEPPERPRSLHVDVTLRPSPLPPPMVDRPDDASVVSHVVTLVSPPPQVTIDLPDSLIAREEVHDDRT